MKSKINFLAVDLGASSGRVLLGQWDGEHLYLMELHRFSNVPVTICGHLHWDVLYLWREIKKGIACFSSPNRGQLHSIGVDAWGVDFALLDNRGNLIGNPYHYRDSRTNGMIELVCQEIPREVIFNKTGNQFIQFNTLFQLYSMVHRSDPHLEIANTLLMVPDLFHYWLTGHKSIEFTIATTSQIYDIRQQIWATDLLSSLKIPTRLLPCVGSPGNVLGNMKKDLTAETGLSHRATVVTPASHDTSSAIAAIPGLDGQSVFISSGTWSLLGVEIQNPIINDQVLALNFTNEGGVAGKVNLQKILAGLWLLQECQRQWSRKGNHYDWDEMLATGEQAEPLRSLVDPDAPDFLNPADMLDAVNNFCRHTGQQTPSSVSEVVRCCLESLALNYRKTIEDLEFVTGQHFDTIRIVGGGSQNKSLSQYTADACQRLVISGPVEATALGNILLQVIASGHLPDIMTGRKIIAASFEQQHYEPGPAGNWGEAYERFKVIKNQKS